MKKIVLILILIMTPFILSAEQIQIGIVEEYTLSEQSEDSNMVAVRNFIAQVNKLTSLNIKSEPVKVQFNDRARLFSFPFIILSKHKSVININQRTTLNDAEKNNLREYLENGGFLLVNDDYGLNKPFRELVTEIYPDRELIELSNNFPLFHSYYKFNGLPKIHKHDGQPAQAYGLFINKRLAILYIYSSDIVDGWDKEGVHENDSPELRTKAIQFGINILYYVMSH